MPDFAAVLLDGGYLDHVTQAFDIQINFQTFSELLCEESGGFTVFRSYYYHCAPYQSSPPTLEERERYARAQSFFTALRRLDRFEVRLGKLELRPCEACGDVRPRQKRVDSILAIDLVRLAAKNLVTKAIIVSGDSDHSPAVATAKEEGVLVSLWHLPDNPRTRAHRELLELCDERYEITGELLERARL